MLRSLLIYLSQAPWARKIVTGWSFAWNAASRFVAGEEIDDAIKVIKYLNDKGINATLDHLGEHTHTAADARNATATILTIWCSLTLIRAFSIRSIIWSMWIL